MKATRSPLAVLSMMLAAATLWLSGCDSVNDESVVATVNGNPITVGYLEAKWAKMAENQPDLFPDSLSLEEIQDRVLDTLIKKELIVITARQEGFVDDETFQKAYEGHKEYKLIELLKNRMIVDKIPDFTEEQLREQHRYLGRQADSRHIEVATEEEAWDIYRKLQAGELSFHDAVMEYSTHQDREAGGKMPTVAFGTSIESIENTLFNMEEGEISEPVKVPSGWALFILDDLVTQEAPPFEQVKDQIRKRLEVRALRSIGDAHGDRVLNKYGFEFNYDTAKEIVPLMPDDLTPSQLNDPPVLEKPILDLSEEQKRMVLYEVEGEKFTLADFSDEYDELSAYARPQKAAGAKGIYNYVRRKMINRVMPKEAKAMGLETDPEMVLAMKEYEEQNSIGAVKRMIVDAPIELGDEDYLAYYEEHPLQYTRKYAVICKQLVTNTEEEIQEAWRRLQEGEPFDSVGADLSITWPKAWQTQYFTPDSIANPENEVFRQVLRLEEPGDYTPAFQYQNFFAIYQLVEESPPTLLPYDEVADRVQREAFEAASAARLESLLVDWRAQAEIEIDEGVLRKTRKGETPNPLREKY